MAAAVQAIGVVAGVLGIVQFGLTNFADNTEPGSTIKIAVGLDGENGGTEDAGGDLPDMYASLSNINSPFNIHWPILTLPAASGTTLATSRA